MEDQVQRESREKTLVSILEKEGLPVNLSLPLLGGASNNCYLIEKGGEQLILRIGKTPYKTKSRLSQAQEFQIVQALRENFPESTKYFCNIRKSAQTEDGFSYSFLEYAPGVAFEWRIFKDFSEQYKNNFGKQMAEAMYAMHSIPLEKARKMGVSELNLGQMLDQELSAVEGMFKNSFTEDEWGLIKESYNQLRVDKTVNTNNCFVHDDLRGENFRFNQRRGLRIFDFGNGMIANPFFDFIKLDSILQNLVYEHYPDKSFLGDKDNFNYLIGKLLVKTNVRRLWGYVKTNKSPEKIDSAIQRVKNSIK